MSTATVSGRAHELAAHGDGFVAVTVVRAQRPTSVRPGDTALVLGDGTLEGFVGGVCTEDHVRAYAVEALRSGEPLLLRILPDVFDTIEEDGAVTVGNPCLSGGGIELFLEPTAGVVTAADAVAHHCCHHHGEA
jgi:xanthine dehydrogenase accessory factor